MYNKRFPIAILLSALAGFWGADVFADSPSVTAVLSNSEAAVGETIELQIKVSGPGDARPPEEDEPAAESATFNLNSGVRSDWLPTRIVWDGIVNRPALSGRIV